MYPSISDYNQTIQHFGVDAFRSQQGLTFIPSSTSPFKIFSYGSGAYAVVFRATNQGKEYAIRCFISADKESIDRYRCISKFLKGKSASWITPIELLENEIRVKGTNYPVIKMEWIQGKLLNKYIDQNLSDNLALTELQLEIVNISQSLELLKIGHGDIQCGNIIVTKSAKNNNILKLIDYDGMFIPDFSGRKSIEMGRSEFQHPNRSQFKFDEKIDRFSFWVILTAIEALKHDKSLWKESMQGGFNTLDNMLFTGNDFIYFESSKLITKLYSLQIPSLTFYLNKLKRFCTEISSVINPPSLFSEQISEAAASPVILEEKLLTRKEFEISSSPSGAVVLTSSFQRLGSTPIKIDLKTYRNRTLIISYSGETKQLLVDENCKNLHYTFSIRQVGEIIQVPSPKKNIADEIKPKPSLPPIVPHVEVKPKSDNSFGNILVIIFIVFIALLFIFKYKGGSDSMDQGYLEENTINATSTTSNNNPGNSFEETEVISMDTIEIPENSYDQSLPTPEYSTSLSRIDGNKLYPEDVLVDFLVALNKGDCNSAWNLTLNPTWEIMGKDWFCSKDAFGGITKIKLNDLRITSQVSIETKINISYYSEDPYNGNRCFYQEVTLRKESFEGFEKWVIVKMKNITLPESC